MSVDIRLLVASVINDSMAVAVSATIIIKFVRSYDRCVVGEMVLATDCELMTLTQYLTTIYKPTFSSIAASLSIVIVLTTRYK